MAYEKDPYNFDKLDQVPDFAMQPARGADEDTFDASVYESLFSDGAAFEPARPAEEPFLPQGSAAAAGTFAETFEEIRAADEKVAEAEPAGAAPVEQEPTEFEREPETELVSAEPQREPETELASAEPQREPETELASAEPQPAEQEAEAVSAELVQEDATSEEAALSEALETVVESAPVFSPEEAELTEPVSVEAPAEPISAPAMSPVSGNAPMAGSGSNSPAHQTPQNPQNSKSAPAKIVPVGNAMMSSNLKMTDIKQKPQIRVFIEEDILVPDVKPDLASILSMDGKLKLSDKEIYAGNGGAGTLKLSGDFLLQTLYIPDHPGENEPIVSIESRIPFKEESEIKAEPYSDVTVIPQLESVDFTVVNERKFKVRATVVIGIREYRELDIALFSGIQGEELQMLKEKIHLTDVSQRKTETMEIQEDLPMKESAPEIGKILRYDVNVVENHKQINREKAVINASVYCNIMYLGENKKEEEDEVQVCLEPAFYQGKTEFTQFIRLDERDGQTPTGSRVRFNPTSVNVVPKENEEGRLNAFELSMNVDTTVELFCDIETEIVSDVYHHEKEIQYDTDEVGLMHLCGNGMAETSTREIVNVPEKNGSVDRVAFLSGHISDVKSAVETGKVIVEGAILMKAACISTDDRKTPFGLRQELPFRCVIDVPGATPEMTADNDVQLKELWFDKINNRQLEVNAGVLIQSSVMDLEKCRLIRNVNFVELAVDSAEQPGIVLYITRPGDNIWKIAKKYRTTIDEIRKINSINAEGGIKPGTKLLIVK